jgi:CRP-like cAMP-binding protein
VPKVVLVPTDTFCTTLGVHLGASLCCLETLALHHLHNHTGPLLVLSTTSVAARICTALSASLLMSIKDTEIRRDDYSSKFPRDCLPRMSREIAFSRPFLRTGLLSSLSTSKYLAAPSPIATAINAHELTINDLITFRCFDDDDHTNDQGAIELKGDAPDTFLFVTQEEGHGGAYKLVESSKDERDPEQTLVKKMTVSSVVKLMDAIPLARDPVPFTPPLFGVTVLGSSTMGCSGDNACNTGYVIWVNRRGILINPPPFAAARLDAEYGVHPGLICDVIVTSVRESNDGGVMQKVMQEESVTVHSTKSLRNRLLTKYTALANLSEDTLKSASLFRRIEIGTPMKICGADFSFFYNVDSSASLGFVCTVGERSLLFASGFTLCPKLLQSMVSNDVITQGRYERLNDVCNKTDYDRVFYDLPLASEEGVMEILEAMGSNEPKFLEKVMVSHCPDVMELPAGIKRAPDGIEDGSTIAFDVPARPYSSATNLIETVEKKVFFQGLSIEAACSLIQIAEKRIYKKGEIISQVGDVIEDFSIIVSGKIQATMSRLVVKPEDLVLKARHDSVMEDDAEEEEEEGENESQRDGIDSQPSEALSASAFESDVRETEQFTTQWCTGDCFGEEALIFGKSSYEAVALTDLEVITIANSDLQWILAGTPVRERIQRINDMR